MIKKILYVDDDQQIRQLMQMYLAGCGFNVLLAEEGNDALTKLKENTEIELLITDINMPNGMGGVDLVKQIRERNIDIPIIVVSGYLKNSDHIEEFGELISYFEKPVNLKILSEKIKGI